MSVALLGPTQTTGLQQPKWQDPALVEVIRQELAGLAPLVDVDAPGRLRNYLAEVAEGKALVLQAGDCAEDPGECTPELVGRKVLLINALADVIGAISGKPVVRVGRIGGQYAKPRSLPTERVGDLELPVFRGHLVNSPVFDALERQADPQRLRAGYRAASEVMSHLGAGPGGGDPAVWTSHEALVLDYEMPLIRTDATGRKVLASTHWPWIGERTRQVDGAHVALLAQVSNPVACKVGPSMDVAQLLELCARLDPHRKPGRLTLIARLGADTVADALPPLVAAVKDAGHPVIWMGDPMHANTVADRHGRKTRMIESIVREIIHFQAAVRSANVTPGGLHLEATPEEVSECISTGSAAADGRYTTLCDPRLNPLQAVSAVSAWSAG
ncbi:3-deoxy-7-phosphoheptulonate synthase [Barrientosiimonas humi]|uniref:3-deoxy-7-phosphoheptulonate synthase n=1 Tax=Barrientosiimonas humi TaxID=999931 RepID=UPI00370D0DA4